MNQHFLALYNCIRRLQQKNQVVFELRLAESHLLTEISADSGKSIQYYQNLLGIEQAVFSRIVKGMLAKGLIKFNQNLNDQRSKHLELTSTGKSKVKEIDQRAEKKLENYFKILTEEEIANFKKYSELLVSQYDLPIPLKRKNEHFFRYTQRRLTRVSSLLKKRFLNTILSPSAWQVLAEIGSHPKACGVEHLCNRLSIKNNNCQQLLHKLKALNYLEIKKDATDHRQIVISITENGLEQLRNIENYRIQEFSKALKELKKNDLFRFINIFEKLVFNYQQTFEDGSKLKFILTQSDKLAARKFMIKELAQNDAKSDEIPDSLISDKYFALALVKQDDILGLCQFITSKESCQIYFLMFDKKLKNTKQVIIQVMTQCLQMEFNVKKIESNFAYIQKLLPIA